MAVLFQLEKFKTVRNISVFTLKQYFRICLSQDISLIDNINGVFPNGIKHLCGHFFIFSHRRNGEKKQLYKFYFIYDKHLHIHELQR